MQLGGWVHACSEVSVGLGGWATLPCFEDPSHSFCGVKDILLLRGMLPAVFRDRQEVTFLGLE